MSSLKTVLLGLLVLALLAPAAKAGKSINVDDPSLMKEAIDFCNLQDEYDTIILTVPGGIYTTHDTMFYEIKKPLTIKAKEGLPEMPIITHSDDSSRVLEMFRVYNDLTLEGVILDGGGDFTHGLKYGIRVGPSPDGSIMPKKGLKIIARNCIFRNFAQDKDIMKQGNAIYFLKNIPTVGKVEFENCRFENISDEAIRMTETEKYKTERCLDTLIVRNSTFVNIGSECIRFYADTDDNTPDAYVLLEHLTINNSATRVMYIKNNWGTIARDIVVTNSHLSVRRPDRNDFVIQIQKPTSVVSNVDTFNLVFGVPYEKRIGATKGGTVDKATIWGFDPLYADAANKDFTLLPGSHAYFSAHDGSALGDLRWATNTPTVVPFTYEIQGGGSITFDPPLEGRCYDPGTVVTMTAVPDSGYAFAGWSGDVSGTDNPATVTVNAATHVVATFQVATGVAEKGRMPLRYRLEQNYPNPFNPVTTVRFSLEKPGLTRLKIFSLLGSEVKTVLDGKLAAGEHTVQISAEGLPSGIYYYELTSGTFRARRKMVVLK